MSERGAATFAGVMAECWRRPGLLVRELAWRWLYGIPALAVIAVACFHIYSVTADTLPAAGAGQISLDAPYQSAAIVAAVMPVVRPVIVGIAIWLLPLLGLGWAVASGVGRNIVFRFYEPGLPWRPAALTGIQAFRVAALAATVALWWGSVRWSAAACTVAGVPNVLVYFAMVAGFTFAFLVIWSLASWVFFMAPMFVLMDGQSFASGLSRAVRPSSARGRLVGVNAVVAFMRFVVAVVLTVVSLVPLGFVSSPRSIPLYLWLAVVTVLYLVVSGFLQVVRLAAFVDFWSPAGTPQNPVSQPHPDHVN